MDASYTMLRADGKAADREQERQLLRRVDHLSEASAQAAAKSRADHVLPIFERPRPGGDRPCRALEEAQLFARDEVAPHDLAEAWSRARDVMTSEPRAVGGDALAVARAAVMCAAVGPGGGSGRRCPRYRVCCP